MGGSNTMERRCSGETLPKNDDQSDSSSIKSDAATSKGTKTRDTMTDILDDAKRLKLFQLLDQWEEPDRNANEYVSGGVV
jgi:hypothetical protein